MKPQISLAQFAEDYSSFLQIEYRKRLAETDGMSIAGEGSVLAKFGSGSPLRFTPSQMRLIELLSGFLESDRYDVFIMKGYAGTGKSTLISLLNDYADRVADNCNYVCQLFTPTGRAAMVLNNIISSTRCTTIHRGIYDTPSIRKGSGTARDFDASFSAATTEIMVGSDQRLESFTSKDDNRTKTLIPIRKDLQAHKQDCLLIFDEASMIGNLYSEMSEFRFGSGCLLDDIMTYAQAGEASGHRHKIIFCGDPAQLFPVGMNSSPALNSKYIKENYHLTVAEFELADVLRQAADSGILSNATRLRESIRNRNFSTLKIQTGRDVIKLTDTRNTGKPNVIPEEISSCPEYKPDIEDELIRIFFAACKNLINNRGEFITFSNKEAYEINTRIRKHIFAFRPNLLEVKDKLIITQNAYVDNEIFLSNGTFAMVSAILPDRFEVVQTVTLSKDRIPPEELPQGLTILDGDKCSFEVKLKLQKIRMKKRDSNGSGNVVEFECWIILNDLEHHSGDTPMSENVALNILIRKGLKEDPTSKEYCQAVSMREALRVRYGYAITCHKAQGNEWDNVFLYSLSRRERNGSEELFHWYYTAITRARKRLYVVNPANIGKFSNIRFLPGNSSDEEPSAPHNPEKAVRAAAMPDAPQMPAQTDEPLPCNDPAALDLPDAMPCEPARDDVFPNDFQVQKPALAPANQNRELLLLNHGISDPDSLIAWIFDLVSQVAGRFGFVIKNIAHNQYGENYSIESESEPRASFRFTVFYNAKNKISNICRDNKSPSLPKALESALMALKGQIFIKPKFDEEKEYISTDKEEVIDFFREAGRKIGASVSVENVRDYEIDLTFVRNGTDNAIFSQEYIQIAVYTNAGGIVTSVKKIHGNSNSMYREIEQILSAEDD
ncbi:MAG: ATP-dependent helicase [Succinivibrionaceae bacterium]|nr:ATP-dependent helicase [Succinivibrionaceae bacterium]